MKKVLIFVGFILFLALVGAGIARHSILAYVNTPLEDQAYQEPAYIQPEFPQIERLNNPKAILVLDVSGSMAQNDKKHLQTEAALRFYQIYSQLAQEILDRGEQAEIAIVLFATVAQVVDWDNSGNPWLPVTERNRQKFTLAVERFLGSGANEPRKGQDTDYLAALLEIERLVKESSNPPAVLFMTDGVFDPTATFSPFKGSFACGSPRDILSRDQEEIERSIKEGSLRFVSASSPKGQTFNGRSCQVEGTSINFPGTKFSADDLLRYRDQVHRKVSSLVSCNGFKLHGAEKGLPLIWAPLYLGPGGQSLQTIKEVLEVPSHLDGGIWRSKGVVHCAEARDLVGEFISVLARWMHLQKISLVEGSQSFQVPAQTQAFAVLVQTTLPTREVTVFNEGEKLHLHGRDDVWSGVGRGDGLWKFSEPGVTVRQGMVFVRPRYRWGLFLPRLMSLRGDGSNKVLVKLYLYSLEKNRPVPASEVLKSLPDEVPSIVRLPEGRKIPLSLVRVQRAGSDPVAYQGEMDFGQVSKGEVEINVDLAILRKSGAPVTTDELIEKIDLQPSLRFVLKDYRGRPTALNLKGIPATYRIVKKLWGH